MQKPVDLSFMDEAEEDPAELLKELPEVRYELTNGWANEELGIRSLLERAEAFEPRWHLARRLG